MNSRHTHARTLAGTLVLLALAAAGTVQAATTVYRWIDERGRVHYSDARQGVAQSVQVAPASGDGQGAEAGTGKAGKTDPAAIDAGSPGGSAAGAGASAASRSSSDDCAARQKRLESYRNAATVVETDGLGQRREYTPQQREQLIKNTEEQVKIACGPQS